MSIPPYDNWDDTSCVCALCDLSYADDDALLIHWKDDHPELYHMFQSAQEAQRSRASKLNLWQCTKCSAKFSSAVILRLHTENNTCNVVDAKTSSVSIRTVAEVPHDNYDDPEEQEQKSLWSPFNLKPNSETAKVMEAKKRRGIRSNTFSSVSSFKSSASALSTSTYKSFTTVSSITRKSVSSSFKKFKSSVSSRAGFKSL